MSKARPIVIHEMRVKYDDGGMEVFKFDPLQLAEDARKKRCRPSELLCVTHAPTALDMDRICSLALPQRKAKNGR